VAKNINIDLIKVAQDNITVTVHLKGRRRFSLGLWLIRLGCLISGVRIEYEEDKDEKEHIVVD